ncbi:MAG: RnfABCDGE type electron transport complex subunit A [Desulfobacteraceae bacterium]|nr:RnfABCDGE type electron transport complex subunit A [Desulfobacteraceae bacterium]
MEYFEIIIAGIFVNNILLAQFLGNCPFLGTSKKMETAVGMSMAVVFVLVMAGVITWIIFHKILDPNKLVYLRTITFILVIASLVQFVEMFLKKSIPALYAGLGIFLPLITTNCAVMGACVINIDKELTFLQALVASFAYAVGFGLALILFAGVRERVLLARVPKPLQDTSIALVIAGVISLSFYAFQGMVQAVI